jgi:tetratricopeptide (TPR) repeat protein
VKIVDRRGRVHRLAAFLLVLVPMVRALPAAETSALEKARQCVSGEREEAVRACREALRMGLPSQRARTLRSVLADELSTLKRWEEAVEVYREQASLTPEDPEAQLRLGMALLFLVNRPSEAVPVLQAGLRANPRSAQAYGALGTALAALDQHPEASAAFAEALRLDPEYFEHRPAARQTYEACQQGKRWP